jgi:hypothetical protein
MRITPKSLSATIAVVGCLAVVPAGAAADPPEVGHFSGVETFGPDVITDLPCLEGTQFLSSGSERFRGTFVNSEGFFHFAGTEIFEGTLVPIGEGLTYVEGGNMNQFVFTARAVDAGVAINQTEVINDQFIAYDENGRRVASATIRVHILTHFVGVDTNEDDVPETFKVSIERVRLSCPT